MELRVLSCHNSDIIPYHLCRTSLVAINLLFLSFPWSSITPERLAVCKDLGWYLWYFVSCSTSAQDELAFICSNENIVSFFDGSAFECCQRWLLSVVSFNIFLLYSIHLVFWKSYEKFYFWFSLLGVLYAFWTLVDRISLSWGCGSFLLWFCWQYF